MLPVRDVASEAIRDCFPHKHGRQAEVWQPLEALLTETIQRDQGLQWFYAQL
jgi:hypothetical protein